MLGSAASARSPEFVHASDTVSSAVVYASSSLVATAAFPKLSGTRFEQCVRAVIAAALGPNAGNAIEAFQPIPATVKSSVQRTSATRFAFTLLENGTDVPAHLDLVFLQQGRVTAELEFAGGAAAVDPSLEQRLVSAVSKRLAKIPGRA